MTVYNTECAIRHLQTTVKFSYVEYFNTFFLKTIDVGKLDNPHSLAVNRRCMF